MDLLCREIVITGYELWEGFDSSVGKISEKAFGRVKTLPYRKENNEKDYKTHHAHAQSQAAQSSIG